MDLLKASKQVKHFRDVFMRDTLPSKPWNRESGIINLDSQDGLGTHWVAYKKSGNLVKYFDSFGNLSPPQEVIKYFKNCEIKYNHDRYQHFNTYNCGHLCIDFLLK